MSSSNGIGEWLWLRRTSRLCVSDAVRKCVRSFASSMSSSSKSSSLSWCRPILSIPRLPSSSNELNKVDVWARYNEPVRPWRAPSPSVAAPCHPSCDRRPWRLSRGFIRPPSSAEWCPFWWSGGSGWRERFKMWTPRKVTANPESREIVLVASVVLKPWNKIKDATTVAVEKPTKYMGLTLWRACMELNN
jgi:hypothetical protein